MLSTALLAGLALGLFMAISVGPTLFAVLKYSVNHSYKAGTGLCLSCGNIYYRDSMYSTQQ